MAAVTVRLPDGSTKEFEPGTTALEFAQSIGPGWPRRRWPPPSTACRSTCPAVLPDGAEVTVVTGTTPLGREVLRHSTAHVLAQAVLRLWPGAHFAIGPVIEDGFYYDFELPGGAHFTDDDLERITAEMRAIMAEEQPFVRHEHSIDEGLELFGDQPFKREIIEAVGAGQDEVDAASEGAGEHGVSTYWNSPAFTDLCRGPHVPTTSKLGHFALMRVAGAYWRGDEKRQQLQRIYGTAWESDEALADHLHRLEEAEKRDHRKLGVELDLFSFPHELGGGLAVWHPKGGIVRKLMEDYSRQRHIDGGYEFVFTPHLANAKLFETSGHLGFYKDGMYPPMEMDNGTYYPKPMNCPMHCLIFDSRQRSYRELPLRLFELGTVYRYERAGTLHGMMRIRGFTQDDSHIFCTEDQLGDEIASLLDFVMSVLRAFGFTEFTANLSTKDPDKYVGSDEIWDEGHRGAAPGPREARPALRDQGGGRRLLRPEDRHRRPRRHRPDVAAQHHPVRLQPPRALRARVRGRRQRPPPPDHAPPGPVRFDRAVLRHPDRALRRCAADVAGPRAGPGPRRARRPPGVRRRGGRRCCGPRASGSRSTRPTEPLGARIRRAKLLKIPYILVVGDEDVAAGTVGVNRRGSDRPDRGVPLAEFTAVLADEIAERHVPEPADDSDGA